MASAEPEEQPNIPGRKTAAKRKRETTASRAAASRAGSTASAFSRRSPPRERPAPPPAADEDGDRSPPRKQKRPGARATVNKEQAEQLQKRREEQERRDVASRQTSGADLVAAHYNAVPERGREWRSQSKIKGLRDMNNWVKSTLIQKFSYPDIPLQQMAVLDMACGKGGDLGKWGKRRPTPSLYVGCDIADVSIDQARQRYAESNSRGGRGRGPPRMHAEFYVKDTFGTSLADIRIIREVGFDPNAGPGPGMIVPGPQMGGGFSVVSMMFALHYSFESEALARGMLRNVAGALRKGGRFIGVMPNSEVISAKVRQLLGHEAPGKTPNGKATPAGGPKEDGEVADENEDEDDWDPEKPSEPVMTVNGSAAPAPAPAPANEADEDDDWDPEKPSEPVMTVNGAADEPWDPEKPSEPNNPATTNTSATPAQNPTPDTTLPPLQWGNSIYNIRFPRHQPLVNRSLPADGIFRPPFGWRYNYSLEEAVDAPEFVVPFEAFRALAEEYGLELLYRKGFREVYEDESEDRELGELAERMGVRRGGMRVAGEEEMEAAGFYCAFCFFKV